MSFDCNWVGSLSQVWLDCTVDTITFAMMSDDYLASVTWLNDAAYEGADFIDRICGCGFDQKMALIEGRVRAMMQAAYQLEGEAAMIDPLTACTFALLGNFFQPVNEISQAFGQRLRENRLSFSLRHRPRRPRV